MSEKVLGFFRKSARDYSDLQGLSKQARKFIRDYKKLFDSLSERNRGNNALTLTAEAQARYSFAGEKAKTADKLKLTTAEQMLEDGVDSETVRKETGWFKGYDGKWRFEIDDSDIEIAFNGKFSRNPEIKRYSDLVEKVYFLATATETEQNELAELDKKLSDQKIEPVKLGDMIKHTVLFEAYPQLEDVNIRFVEGLGSTNGMWDAQFNEIVLAKSLKMDKRRAVKTLLHEIQHAIQYYEGFAYGASPEYWVANPIFTEDGNEKLRAAQKKLDDVYQKFRKEWKDDINWSLAKEYKRLQELWWESSDATYYEQKMSEIEKLAKEAGFDDLLDEYLVADAEFEVAKGSAKKIPSHELYQRTAGEIEARDVANRLDLNSEQRKNTRPDIDRSDVVFANGSNTSYLIVELDNGMQYVEATESQVITGTDPIKWAKQVAYYINNTIRGGNDFVIKTEQGDFLTITRDTAYKASSRNQIRNPDGTYRLMTDAEYRTKLNASVHINELSQVSKKWNKNNVPDTKNHKFAKDGFSYRTAYFKDFDGKYYRLTISVGEKGTVSTIYNVGQIKKDALPNGKIKTIYSGSKANSTSYDYSIAETSEKSNPSDKKTSEKSSKGQSGDVDTTARNSLPDGKRVVVRKDRDLYDGVALEDYWKVAKKYMEERYRDVKVDGVGFNTRSKREYTNSGYTSALYNKDKALYKAKMQAVTELDNMIRAARFIAHEDTNSTKGFDRQGYDRYAVDFSIDNDNFSGELLIAISEEGERNFYDVVSIKQEAKIPSDARFSLPDDNSIANQNIDTDEDLGYTRLKNDKAGKVNEDSQNSEILERETISTTRRSDIDFRKQNKNTKTLQGLLGLSDEELRKGNFKAGHSEWLEDYQGELGYGAPEEKQSVRRFLQRFCGELSRRKLNNVDTAGRNLSPSIIKKFSDTVFKAADGTLLSLWHWTDRKFSIFERGDIGFHAGTFDASHAIMFDKSKQGEKGYFKEMYVNSKSPLFIDRDLGSNWTPELVAAAANVFTDNEISSISKLDGHNIQQYNSKASIRLREILKNKGYDSIIYTNDWEGGLSVIVFENEQFHTVAENGIDIEYVSEDLSSKRYSLSDNWESLDLLTEIFGNDPSEEKFDFKAVLERGSPRPAGAAKMTVGELKKTIANHTHYKVYSKKAAFDVISQITGVTRLTAKTRGEFADAIWQGFNDCTDVESRRTFAHDMAEFMVAKMLTESKVENPDVEEAREMLAYLGSYIGQISFHPEYLSEIRHIADKSGLKKILGRWGYKGKKGTRRVPSSKRAQISPPPPILYYIAFRLSGEKLHKHLFTITYYLPKTVHAELVKSEE